MGRTRITQAEWDRRAAEVGLEWLAPVRSAQSRTYARCVTCGHEWAPAPSKISRHGCARCARRAVAPDEWERRGAAAGLEWLAPIGGSKTPTLARCLTCAHEWSAKPYSVYRGYGCPRCVRITQDEWERRGAAAGLEWLAPVAGSADPTPARCLTCGHEWSPKPNNVQQGRGCRRCAVARKATALRLRQDEWDRRAAAAGLEWLAPVAGAASPTLARCLTCGHEWSPWPSRTSGCPSCAPNARLPHDEWDRRAARAGLEWLQPVGDANTPTLARCLTCGHEWSPRPHHVNQGSGCGRCAALSRGLANTIPAEEWDRRAARAGLEWLQPVRGVAAPVPARCLTCGYEWAPWPGHVMSGGGCPACAPSGFDSGAPALVYLLTYGIGDLMKVGIANATSGRIRKHASRGWEQVATWSFERGADAADTEGAVLAWWRERGAWFADRDAVPAGDGFTETVHIGRVDVPDTVEFIAEILKGE